MSNDTTPVGGAASLGLYVNETQIGRRVVPVATIGLSRLNAPKQVGLDVDQVTEWSSGMDYRALVNDKEHLTQLAKSIRDVVKGLGQIDDFLIKVVKTVGMMKNYPPFPDGNEDRLHYIQSLNGLRKELEAITVPKVVGSAEPVLYPQEVKLPVLDPGRASDADVHNFGKQAEVAQSQLADTKMRLHDLIASHK